MAKTRYTQAQTVANEGFRGLVKASLMVNAYIVLVDTDHPNHAQRAGLSRTLLYAMTPPSTIEAIIELFCWWAVNDATLIAEYSAAGGDIAQITDETIDAAVLAFWDDASAVTSESEE